MSYHREYTLIVTTIYPKYITKIYNRLRNSAFEIDPELISCITPITISPLNGRYTLCVLTSGSVHSVGDENDTYQRIINKFIDDWKKDENSEINFNHDLEFCHWVYLQYGDDELDTKILDHSENSLYNIEEE